jgi:hypothetical protein
MKSLAYMLSVLVLTIAAFAPTVRAQQPSFIDQRVRWPDTRDAVEPTIRRRSGGWEIRSQHFAVFSPHSADQSTQLANAMESAWSDMENLADHWTTTHRAAHFGQASVNVRVLQAGERAEQNSPTSIFFSTSAEPLSDSGMIEIRKAAIRAFMNVSGMDRTLPSWLQEGLTSYVAGERDTEVVVKRTNLSSQPNATWARALLEANDGQHAWALFDAIQQTMRDGQSSHLSRLARETNLPQLAATWTKNPLAGQPILKMPENLDAETTAIVADMFDVLKLSRRFPASPRQSVRSHFVGAGLLKDDRLPAANENSNWSLRPMEEELFGSQKQRWAMLDARGALITSRDRDQLKALFRRAQQRLVPVAEGDQRRLRAVLDDGRVVEGWFTENREQASRPILNIRVRSAASEPDKRRPEKKIRAGGS